MKSKSIALLLSTALVLLLFSACGSTAAESSAPPNSSPSEASTVSPSVQETDTGSSAGEQEITDSSSASSASAEEISEASAAETAPDYRESLAYPIADGDVSFTILHSEPALGPMSGQMNMSTYGDFESIALGTEAIGVTPEWQALSAMTGDTQFNLIVASGDYPDVFSSVDKFYTGSMTKALEDEVITVIDSELLAENMPEYWNILEDDPKLKKAVTSETGEFLAWYSVFDKTIVNEGYFIRKDWCDKLNMEVPTSLEELNDFLYSAKSEFTPESVMILGEDLGTMVEAFGVSGAAASGSGFAYHREDDHIVADITSEKYEAYIKQLREWYSDGIVSQNFTELDTGNMAGDMERELMESRTAIVRTMVNSMDNLQNPDPDFALSAMVVTQDGGNIHTGQGERQFDSCCLSTQCDPDLYPYILGWMNYWYTEEGAMLGSYGIEGTDYSYDDNGNIYYLEGITQNPYGYPPMLYSRARCFSGAAFGLMYQDRTVPFFTDAQTEAINCWTSRTDDEQAVPQTLNLTTEEAETVYLYAPDLATYISEVIPKFVTGELPLSEWDAFMEDVSSMHAAELTEVYQAAYDRYTAE